jgi:hypothetical protein
VSLLLCSCVGSAGTVLLARCLLALIWLHVHIMLWLLHMRCSSTWTPAMWQRWRRRRESVVQLP